MEIGQHDYKGSRGVRESAAIILVLSQEPRDAQMSLTSKFVQKSTAGAMSLSHAIILMTLGPSARLMSLIDNHVLMASLTILRLAL